MPTKNDRSDETAEDVTRTVLVHLNVRMPEDDLRSAEVIGDAIMACYEVGSDNAFTLPLRVTVALAQEL